MEPSIELQIKKLATLLEGRVDLLKQFQQLEREYRHRDSIWEARMRYARRGLEVTNRELGLANSQLAKANKDLNELRAELENKVIERTRDLRFERDRIKQIIAQLTDGLMVIDPNGQITVINMKAEELIGISRHKPRGFSLTSLQENPETRTFSLFLQKLPKDGTRQRIELNGGDRKISNILEVTKTSLRSGVKDVSTVVLVRDVTREATIDRLKSEFISLTAHQLRTPLSGIKWVLNMLLDGDAGPLTPKQKDLIKKSEKANERMINLVKDLLDVVRIEEGRFDFRFVKGSVLTVVRDLMEEIKARAVQKGLDMRLNISDRNLPKSMLDQERLRLALLNILDNSLQYTHSGGKIIVTVAQKSGYIIISVRDTGIGIPADQMPIIFTKFFRSRNAIQMQPDGNGLGLYIAKNIIDRHGGRVWIESEEGKGTTVFFTIPILRKK